VRPLLVHTVPLAGGVEGKAGCGGCSITVGCLLAGSLLVGISGIMSSREAVGDFCDRYPHHVPFL